MAYFHAGRYQESVDAIETNRQLAGPMGPHMYAYLAAAYAMSGNMGRARAAAERVRAASSDFSITDFIGNLFRDPEDQQLVFLALQKAGFDTTEL